LPMVAPYHIITEISRGATQLLGLSLTGALSGDVVVRGVVVGKLFETKELVIVQS